MKNLIYLALAVFALAWVAEVHATHGPSRFNGSRNVRRPSSYELARLQAEIRARQREAAIRDAIRRGASRGFYGDNNFRDFNQFNDHHHGSQFNRPRFIFGIN